MEKKIEGKKKKENSKTHEENLVNFIYGYGKIFKVKNHKSYFKIFNQDFHSFNKHWVSSLYQAYDNGKKWGSTNFYGLQSKVMETCVVYSIFLIPNTG